MDKHLSSTRFLSWVLGIALVAFLAIIGLAAACHEFSEFIGPWRNYIGTFLGSVVGFAALGLAAVINADQTRLLNKEIASEAERQKKLAKEQRLNALYRLLESEAAATHATCSSMLDNVEEALAAGSSKKAYHLGVGGPFVFPSLVVVDRFLDEIAEMEEEIRELTLLLFHGLREAQSSLDGTLTEDRYLSHEDFEEFANWLRAVSQDAKNLRLKLRALLKMDSVNL